MAVITGLFNNPGTASSAINALEGRGIPASEISIIAAEGIKRESFGIEPKSKAAEGAAIGAGIGGAVGALVAGFTLVGALATGGASLLVAGPLVAALAGAGAGATAGGALGTVVGLGIPENEIKYYDDALRKGSVLVGVQCRDAEQEEAVEAALKAAGASKVSRA